MRQYQVFQRFCPAMPISQSFAHATCKNFHHFSLIFLKYFFNSAHYMLGSTILPR